MTNTANTDAPTIAGEPPYSAQDALAIYEAAFSAGLEQGHRETAHKLKFAADEIARHKAALDSARADFATADELRDYATRRNAYLEGELEALTLDNEALCADIDAAERQIEDMRARRNRDVAALDANNAVARGKVTLSLELLDAAALAQILDFAGPRFHGLTPEQWQGLSDVRETLAADLDAAEKQLADMRARRDVVTEPGQPQKSGARQGSMFSRAPGRSIFKAAILAAALFAFWHFARAAL